MGVQCAANDFHGRPPWQITCGFTLARKHMGVQCAANDFHERATWRNTCGFTLARNHKNDEKTQWTQIWYEKNIFNTAVVSRSNGFFFLNYFYCYAPLNSQDLKFFFWCTKRGEGEMSCLVLLMSNTKNRFRRRCINNIVKFFPIFFWWRGGHKKTIFALFF